MVRFYLSKENFKDSDHYPNQFFDELIIMARGIIADQNTDYISRYRNKYDQEEFLPFWIIVEKMSFGQLVILLGNIQRSDRIALSKNFDLPYKVFGSWLHSLTFIRNACAHHDRLWNRYIQIRPRIPQEKTLSIFHTPVQVRETNEESKLFPLLVIIQYLLNHIVPMNDWGGRLNDLISNYPQLPLEEIGFPKQWRDVPVWSGITHNNKLIRFLKKIIY